MAPMAVYRISPIEMPLHKCQRAFFAQAGISLVEVVMGRGRTIYIFPLPDTLMSHFERKVRLSCRYSCLNVRGETRASGDVCASYLEREEIAGIAENGGIVANDPPPLPVLPFPPIKQVTQRDKTKR